MLIQRMIVYQGPRIMINPILDIWNPEKMAVPFKRLVVICFYRLSLLHFVLYLVSHESHSTCHYFFFYSKCQKIKLYRIEEHFLSHFTKSPMVITAQQATHRIADAFKDSPGNQGAR